MFNNSKLKMCVKFSHEVTLYIPSTNGVDSAADTSAEREEAARLLADLFGGATSTPARGYWMSETRGLVGENTTLIFAYAAENDLNLHLDEVVNFCENLKIKLNQESVALEIDNIMYFI